MKLENILNWAEVSRHLANNESSVSKSRCPKKYQAKVKRLITHLEQWDKEIRE